MMTCQLCICQSEYCPQAYDRGPLDHARHYNNSNSFQRHSDIILTVHRVEIQIFWEGILTVKDNDNEGILAVKDNDNEGILTVKDNDNEVILTVKDNDNEGILTVKYNDNEGILINIRVLHQNLQVGLPAPDPPALPSGFTLTGPLVQITPSTAHITPGDLQSLSRQACRVMSTINYSCTVTVQRYGSHPHQRCHDHQHLFNNNIWLNVSIIMKYLEFRPLLVYIKC